MSNQTRDHLTQPEYDALVKQRKVLTKNRLANHVSVAETLLAVLDSPLKVTVTDLLTALSTLAAMTDPNQSPNPDPSRNPNVSSHHPSLEPAWADRKLRQTDRILAELAGHIDGWTHRPHDPTDPARCDQCGRKRSRDDLHCRQCGTKTARRVTDVIRECEWCGTGYVPMKQHARYCRDACRVAAHRAGA